MALRTDREKCAHLLRRFGLGASEAELDYYLKDGFAGAIDKLLDYNKVDEGFNVDVNSLANDKARLNPKAVAVWWVARLLTTQRPLQEKMTLFWHDHFATSAEKVTQGPMMYAQNEILRQGATGNFRDLLMTVSKDPAMLFWLDNQYNVKGHANENFAREVMELFTLGIGNYTEADVLEGARAFTGWSIQRRGGKGPTFAFRPAQHDNGTKNYLGISGNLSGEDVLNHLCDLPRTAEYITWKLWEWFAYPNPDKNLIGRLADRFRGAKLEISELLRSIMTSSEFYSDQAERAVYKNPVDFVVVTLRELGVGQILSQTLAQGTGGANPLARMRIAGLANQAMKQMGMELLYPPDVSGWEGGSAWVSTATMVERIAWADKVFGGRLGGRFSSDRLFAGDSSAKGVATKLVSIFDAPTGAGKLAQFEAAASSAMGSALTPQNANKVAAGVGRLIFAAPEFQFS